ncbi:VOC family protein [Pseudomonas sp.]|jgi:catechol 2,3-dioxygenase-like lactoylglutathione lyase family enzyme|uniref:VOC family protein n=1 Tax=Pseudomonas sp. TaxID=306 RepID=UPI00260B990B|nr:VOC family protein [Pseudomonas sp.]
MSIRRVNHAVLSVSDLEASTMFYRDVLGLELVAILPAQGDWKEMRFFRASGESTNHHDVGIIANATLPLPGRGQPSVPGLFHVAFEVGTIEELESMGQRLKEANAFIDCVEQPMHLSVYGRDPDGLSLEVVWRVPNVDWSYEDLWRRPLDFDAVKDRWGGTLTTGSAAGEPA